MSAKALGIWGSDTDLILTTIHGTRSVTTKVIEGLVVVNIKEEDVKLDLPRTVTRNVIPADRSEIPQPDVICKMSHLRTISTETPSYMAVIEVGLPIGPNCPSALRPREIIYGEESGPYAVRSLLGRYISSPLCTSQQNGKLTCNRINVDQKDTTSRGYVVSQRMVKEQIPHRQLDRCASWTSLNKKKWQQCHVKTSSSAKRWRVVSFIFKTCITRCPSSLSTRTSCSLTTMHKQRSAWRV